METGPRPRGETRLKSGFDTPWSGLGIGGSLACDFTNTVDWRLREKPTDALKDFSDLLRWGWSTGTLTKTEARRLRSWGEMHPRAATQLLAASVDVREAIAAVFQALSRGEAVPAEPLTVIEAACRDAWSARSLRPAGRSGAAWEWRDESSAPHRPAWTAALDAARILTSEDRTRIRECGDAACGWLFLDASRNRSRRWCTMEGCGNRNKARNFYRRSSKQ